MPEFLILFRGRDGRSLRTSPDAYAAHLERLGAWMAAAPSGVTLHQAAPLMPAPTILRAGAVVTDGPFIEAKEMVGGYLSFAAPSLAVATTWASACPIFEFPDGFIELREIEALDA